MITQKYLIAGVDEVGKGCLFGPVFAAAVILNKSNELTLLNKGLKDSKKLSCNQRNNLVPLIKQNSIAWSLGQSSAKEIDRLELASRLFLPPLEDGRQLVLRPPARRWHCRRLEFGRRNSALLPLLQLQFPGRNLGRGLGLLLLALASSWTHESSQSTSWKRRESCQ